ncbi:MAG: hypothetical protein WCA64_00215 [Gallionella sp.]
MLNLPPEPTDAGVVPLFRDAESCAQWLNQLQLTNLQLAHSQLLTQISEFNRLPLDGLERLNTLELLRDTVHYVQRDFARKLISRPLPLSDSELITLLSIVKLWLAMALGYQHCLQERATIDKRLGKRGAQLCQRCLLYSGLAILEHLRTGYEFDPAQWQHLHSLYAFAEGKALQHKEIPDSFNGNFPLNSCRSSYVKILLTCHARTPELSRSQLQMLDAWLSEWSTLVPVQRSYTASKGDAQPLALDLGGTQGLQPIQLSAHRPNMRYLTMMPLSKMLRVKTILLQQGQTPRQLKLGDNYSAPECIELLTHLHRCWCEDNSTRFANRSPDSQSAQLCFQTENIHALLSGKAAPGSNPELEGWQLENQSLLGAMLARVDTAGARLASRQLVALRIGAAETKLGVTTWVSVTRAGQMRIGVRYLPGAVQAIMLQAAAASESATGTSTPALLLLPVAALKTPASLIVPNGWFEPGRIAEIRQQDGTTQRAKTGFSVDRGIDYERVSFALL